MLSLCRTWYRKSMYREANLRVWNLLSLSDGRVGIILRNEAKASFRDCVRWRSRILAMVRWLCGSSRAERLPGLGLGKGEGDGLEEVESWGFLLILLGSVEVNPGSSSSWWVVVKVTAHIWSSARDSIWHLWLVMLGVARTTGHTLDSGLPWFSKTESTLPAGFSSVDYVFSLMLCHFFLGPLLSHCEFLPVTSLNNDCLPPFFFLLWLMSSLTFLLFQFSITQLSSSNFFIPNSVLQQRATFSFFILFECKLLRQNLTLPMFYSCSCMCKCGLHLTF